MKLIKTVMRFKVLVLLALLFPVGTIAQENKGIRFDKSMSWEEVVKKATRENKYIFMDVMATWCGPCQAMAQAVFPNEEVGNFFNEHFVCVKLQLNKTANDDEYVKAWYQEAEKIQKTYKIQSVPTLLFFNSKGEIVHSMSGATNNAGAFIELGKNALDEKQQLYTRLRAFEAGERDVEFLYDLSIDFAMRRDGVNAMKVANVFWQTITPEERVLEKGIRYANDFMSGTRDETFRFFLEHPEEVDAVLGEGSAKKKVGGLIEREMVLPLVNDSARMPEWDGIYNDLCVKYPSLEKNFKEMVSNRKMYYAQRYRKDDLYLEALLELIPIYGEQENGTLARSYAHQLGKKAQNREQRNIALKWLKEKLDEKDAVGMAYYAEILFLSGQKKEGRKYIDLAVKSMGQGDFVYTEVKRIKEEYAN